MERNVVEMYLSRNKGFFPQEKLSAIKESLTKLDDSQYEFITSLKLKDPIVISVFSIFLGYLGVDRFMLGEKVLGIVKLLTGGGLFIWWVIDLVNSKNMAQQYNYKVLENAFISMGLQIEQDSQSLQNSSKSKKKFDKKKILLIVLILAGVYFFNNIKIEETFYIIDSNVPVYVYGERSNHLPEITVHREAPIGELHKGDTVTIHKRYEVEKHWMPIVYKNKTGWIDDRTVEVVTIRKGVDEAKELWSGLKESLFFCTEWMYYFVYFVILGLSILLFIIKKIRKHFGNEKWRLVNLIIFITVCILEIIYISLWHGVMVLIENGWVIGIITFFAFVFLLYNQFVNFADITNDIKDISKSDFSTKYGLYAYIGILGYFLFALGEEFDFVGALSNLAIILAVCFMLIQVLQIIRALFPNVGLSKTILYVLLYLIGITATMLITWQFAVFCVIIIIFIIASKFIFGTGLKTFYSSKDSLCDAVGNEILRGEHLDVETFRAENGDIYKRRSGTDKYYKE